MVGVNQRRVCPCPSLKMRGTGTLKSDHRHPPCLTYPNMDDCMRNAHPKNWPLPAKPHKVGAVADSPPWLQPHSWTRPQPVRPQNILCYSMGRLPAHVIRATCTWAADGSRQLTGGNSRWQSSRLLAASMLAWPTACETLILKFQNPNLAPQTPRY